MTAHQAYELVVGEIGIDRKEFLYDLKLWEIRAIIRGYRKREHSLWHIARWQTFWIMHNGMLDMKKAGLHSERDLCTFPWEKEKEVITMTDEEIENERKKLQEINAARE